MAEGVTRVAERRGRTTTVVLALLAGLFVALLTALPAYAELAGGVSAEGGPHRLPRLVRGRSAPAYGSSSASITDCASEAIPGPTAPGRRLSPWTLTRDGRGCSPTCPTRLSSRLPGRRPSSTLAAGSGGAGCSKVPSAARPPGRARDHLHPRAGDGQQHRSAGGHGTAPSSPHTESLPARSTRTVHWSGPVRNRRPGRGTTRHRSRPR